MDELVPLFDEQGNPLGSCALKSEAHKFGWWHGTVHLWVCCPEGKLIFQKRSPSKQVFPGQWDVSVAGHIQAWETPVEAVIRESLEELGLRVEPGRLQLVGVFASAIRHETAAIHDREWHHTFIYTSPVELQNLKPDPLEVSDLDCFDRSLLLNLASSNKREAIPLGFVLHEPEYTARVSEAFTRLFG